MVIDVGVVHVDLDGPREVREGHLRVLVRVLAPLDVEGGPLDEGVHPEFGRRGLVRRHRLQVGEGGRLLLAQDVEGACVKTRKVCCYGVLPLDRSVKSLTSQDLGFPDKLPVELDLLGAGPDYVTVLLVLQAELGLAEARATAKKKKETFKLKKTFFYVFAVVQAPLLCLKLVVAALQTWDAPVGRPTGGGGGGGGGAGIVGAGIFDLATVAFLLQVLHDRILVETLQFGSRHLDAAPTDEAR